MPPFERGPFAAADHPCKCQDQLEPTALPVAMMRLGLALTLTAAAAAVAHSEPDTCTFTPHCDYGKGSRSMVAAATKEACCTACTNRPGCAAGVFDGKVRASQPHMGRLAARWP